MGIEPRIIPAKYTKPFNKGQKNDYNDVDAIAEGGASFEPEDGLGEEQDQLDLRALHCVRFCLDLWRTAIIN